MQSDIYTFWLIFLLLSLFQNEANNQIIVQQETESESEDYGKDVVSFFYSPFLILFIVLILNFTQQKKKKKMIKIQQNFIE